MNPKEKNAAISRLRELKDTLVKEKRSMNAAEKAEFETLSAQLKENNNNSNKRDNMSQFNDVEKYMRECASNKKSDTLTFERTQNGLLVSSEVNAISPVTIEDVRAVFPQSIFEKVGIPLQYDVQGDVYWPYINADAQVYFGTAQGTAVTDSEWEINKVYVAPERIAISTPISKLALSRTAGLAEDITFKHLPRLMNDAIDKILFSLSKVSGFSAVSGPFVGLTPTVAGATSATFANLTALKGSILAEGINEDKLCWTMTAATYAALEATSTDTGSGIMIARDGKILGIPVYITKYMKDASNVEYIGLGDWSYVPTYFAGGPLSVSMDATSSETLKKGIVEFVMSSAISVNPILNSKTFKLLKLASA